MKNCIMVLLLVAMVTFAGVNFGPQVGLWIPTGELRDASYRTGNCVGSQVLISVSSSVSLEGSIGYAWLKLDDTFANNFNVDFSGSVIPITTGLRVKMPESMYMNWLYVAGGFELDIISINIASIEYPEISSKDTETEIGCYFGSGLVIAETGLDFNTRFHVVDFDTDCVWISTTLGYNF